MPDSNIKANDEISDEYTELISNTLPWFLRWGMASIFSLFLVFFILSWFIKYPYSVNARFKLVSTSYPQVIASQSNGRLRELKVVDGSKVKDNQILAFLESTANANDIIDLKKKLQLLYVSITHDDYKQLEAYKFTKNYKLGDLQKNYEDFNKSLIDFNSSFNNGYYQKEKNVILNELIQLQKLSSNLKDQKIMKEKDMLISQEKLSIQKKLLEKKIIAPSELRNEESNYIAKSLPYKESSSSIINMDLSLLAKKRELIDIEQKMTSSKENLVQSIKSLLSDIEKWSQEFIIKAPANGSVVFITPLQNGQYIKINTDLFYIVNSTNNFLGELMISQNELGRIKVNQTVHVKFKGYPFQEYGYVIGKIKNISNVPLTDSIYRAYVDFPHGLKTNQNKILTPRWGMTGNTEILTDDSRVMYRLLSGLIPR